MKDTLGLGFHKKIYGIEEVYDIATDILDFISWSLKGLSLEIFNQPQP